MSKAFDKKRAKEFLSQKEQRRQEAHEELRQQVLEKITSILKEKFSDADVEVYLVGSISKPYQFHKQSDIDIVLKNFSGDRFDIWTWVESQIGRNVEVILYEKCHFQEHIEREGLRVV